MEQQIGNPVGANQRVSNFISGLTDDGELLSYGGDTQSFRANAAIRAGAAVMWVAPTATVPISITEMTVAADPRLFAGIAARATAIGRMCPVVGMGHALVFANAQTVAFGDVIKVPGTNTGECSFSATDPDATTIAGTVVGVCMGVKGAVSLLASSMIQPR